MRNLSQFFLYIIVILAFVVSSCGGSSIDGSIEAAENSLANNDYSEATSICNRIAERDSMNDLTVNQLCRLSMIYMQLSENRDEDVNVAMATRCFHLAMEHDADSASSFYNNIPVDNQHWVHFLNALNKVLDAPRDFFPEESTDSIFIPDSTMIIDDIDEPHYHNH